MKQVVLVGAILTLGIVACGDDTQTTSPDVQPQFDIQDALHDNGNSHFFWIAPLVPQPKQSDFNGPFDPIGQPSVEICELELDGANGTYQCEGGRENVIERFEPADLNIEVNHYHVDWDLPNNLRGKFRIFALAGNTATELLREFGFRDIEINGDGGADADFYGVKRGSNVPIKFRVEEGAICDGVEQNCATGTITEASGGFTSGDGLAGIFFKDLTVESGELVTVKYERLDSTGDKCLGFGTPTGDPNDFPTQLDLAFFPECWRISTFPENATLNEFLEFDFCVTHSELMIDDLNQQSNIRLYRAEDDGSNVQVMDLVLAPQLDCVEALGQSSSPLVNLARDLIRRVTEPFRAAPLHASLLVRDQGATGGLGPGSIVGTYMPASLRAAVGTFDSETGFWDLGVHPVGTALPDVSVIAEDVDDFPVMRSRVKFTAGAGTSVSDIVDETQGTGNPTGEDTVRTAVDGIASATWTLNQAGQRTLTVSGIGYSTPPKTGDGGVNGLEDISSNPFVVTFTALACDEPATGEVDGVVAEGEYSELLSQTFDANISGGSSAPSVLYFRNDCENIYLALTVDAGPGVDKVNSWRIDLDDDKNGRSVGDDVVIIDVDDPTAGDPTRDVDGHVYDAELLEEETGELRRARPR